MTSLRACVLLLCLALAGAVLPAGAASAAASEAGTFYPLTSSRLLDTRNGTGAADRPVGQAGTINVQITGRGGVPTTGAAAVVVNITVTSATTGGFVSVYPSGEARPSVSTINFVKGVSRANGATVKLGTGGKLAVYNNSGSTEVIIDVLGYYASATGNTTTGAEFDTYGPDRLHDTRQDTEGPLAGQDILTLHIDFADGDANGFIKALAVNVTAVGAQRAGFLSVFSGGVTAPKTSTLNFGNSAAIANTAVVQTTRCTNCADPQPVQFAVYNGSAASVHVIVDLVGIYFDDGTVGLRFQPLSPKRISDSRTGLNAKPLTAAQTQTLTAPTTVASSETVALVGNATAIRPSSSTFLTLWQGGTARPPVSNLNAPADSTVANGAVNPLPAANAFNVYNAGGTTNFVIDVNGRFNIGPSTNGLAAAQSNGYGKVSTSSQRQPAGTGR